MSNFVLLALFFDKIKNIKQVVKRSNTKGLREAMGPSLRIPEASLKERVTRFNQFVFNHQIEWFSRVIRKFATIIGKR